MEEGLGMIKWLQIQREGSGARDREKIVKRIEEKERERIREEEAGARMIKRRSLKDDQTHEKTFLDKPFRQKKVKHIEDL